MLSSIENSSAVPIQDDEKLYLDFILKKKKNKKRESLEGHVFVGNHRLQILHPHYIQELALKQGVHLPGHNDGNILFVKEE